VTARAPSVALLSLEKWDDQWRRNQHLAAQLVRQELVREVLFVNPATSAPPSQHSPEPGITVITPRRRLPNRLAGTQLLGARLRAGPVGRADVLWVNDPVLGRATLGRRQPVIYDVTDDWRTAPAAARLTRRTIRAEDELAHRAVTVVCSEELSNRWRDRYAVDPALVHNAVDDAAWRDARTVALPGPSPHVGYVGTLHEERLDLDLLERLALDDRLGTIHLVGPDVLTDAGRRRLRNLSRMRLHGPVHAEDVPSWTKSFDVLMSPHRVTAFTLSLDAIKSYEYLASGRPIVATPTSGFQHLERPLLCLVGPDEFPDAVYAASSEPPSTAVYDVPSWERRAQEFAHVIQSASRCR
jgi:glycosyltransferase involved in cell wall biosynthesis